MTKLAPFLSIIFSLASWNASKAGEVIPPKSPSPERQGEFAVNGHILKPAELPAPELSELKVPDGFRIERFARNVGNARILAVGPTGAIYVTRRSESDVLKYKIGADGLSDGPPVRVAGRAGLHGIAFHKNKVYLATVHEIFSGEVMSDGSFGPLAMLIHDLPDAGQHHTRTVQIGPDEKMYISVGSTCNECSEPNPEAASLLRSTLDGKRRAVFASGLRDTIGWGWHPQTGELWGMDHGMDWLGDNLQPEELNHIQQGKNFGWPYIFADNKINPRLDPEGGVTKAELKKTAVRMVMGYTAHSAPMQLSFYTANQFPAEYKNSAFISMRGSWNRKPPSGYEVVQIKFENGQPVKFEPFVTGFLTERGQSGRIVGNVIAPDGSLLFSDDRNGVIYRVSYVGTRNSAAEKEFDKPTTVPSLPMEKENHDGEKLPLASQELKTSNRLQVESTAFQNGRKIPLLNSAYDQGASLPLKWSQGPAGTRSYAILMEDPDVSFTPLPMVHWVAWNIPATTFTLPEGLATADRSDDPKGLCQGLNGKGTVGYYGPRPPSGETSHHYHLQVFAVDKELELAPGSNRADLIAALENHVLAKGELKGLFEYPKNPTKP